MYLHLIIHISNLKNIFRYHVERGFMVVPKSVSKKRLQENFDIFDFQLKSEDMKELLDLDCNGRYLTMEM